ncbi:MAG: hypothetical protein ACO20F_10475 [Robiginitalea sp.]|jgi:hypothetical protein|nr:MAG: hypothetical protein JSW57_00190 [Flavobacteriaceae bacterium]
MALFIGIFVALVVINIVLLAFSTSLRYSSGRQESPGKVKAPKQGIYPLKVSDSNYQKAV